MLRTQDKRIQVHQGVPQWAAPATAQAAYCREVMRDTPRAFWPLQDASGNPVDVSGNGLDMTTIAGTPDYRQAGPFGNDYSILTAGGESIARSTQVSTVQNNFTMEMWVIFEIVAANDQLVLHNGSVGANGWGIRMDTGDRFCGLAGGVAEQTVRGIGLFTWTHLVVLRDSSDSSRWKYYQNGVVTLANAGTTNPTAPSGTTQFGHTNLQMRSAYIAIYETALSAARIAAHFNAAGIRGTNWQTGL